MSKKHKHKAHHRPSAPSQPKKPVLLTRCLSCKWEWFTDVAEQCPQCGSRCSVQQKNAVYRCLNCEKKFVDYPGPGIPTQPIMCPNAECRSVVGPRHPGNPEERGIYYEWLNFEELFGQGR